MRPFATSLTALLVALLTAAPLAAAAQSYSGTYTAPSPQGNPLTLVLKQDAKKAVTGSLSGNGTTFPLKGEIGAEGLTGLIQANNAQVFILAKLNGAQLDVIFADPGRDGRPNLQAARRVAFARSGPGKKPGAPAGAPSGGGQLAQFLTRNPWCAFSYNKNTGTSRQERVVFHADGVVSQSSGAESYSSGAAGTVAGQSRGGKQGRWKVANETLHLSEDGMNWTPQPLQITQNSNGYPIIKSEGKEYMVCR